MRYVQKHLTSGELRRLQLVQAALLKEFDRVCRLCGIKYIIGSGTLLGAVRYKGFIPWDDDIDVEMLREDYEKFRKVAGNQLNKDVFFQDHKTDRRYPWLYAKLRMNGTSAVRLGQEHLKMHSGVFIDIFPRDPLPDHERGRLQYENAAKICRKILYARVAKKTAEQPLARLGWTVVSAIPKSIPFGIVSLLQKGVNPDSAKRVRSYGYHGRYETEGYDKRWFTELTELEFEGGKYYAPADWDGYLAFVYGADYMTPPPASERTGTAPLSSFYF